MMVPKREYSRFKEDCEVLEYHNNNHCTNIWLGVICVLLFLQATVVVGAGITSILIYSHNQDKVEAWINLPWKDCLLYTSPSPRDATLSRMPSSA